MSPYVPLFLRRRRALTINNSAYLNTYIHNVSIVRNCHALLNQQPYSTLVGSAHCACDCQRSCTQSKTTTFFLYSSPQPNCLTRRLRELRNPSVNPVPSPGRCKVVLPVSQFRTPHPTRARFRLPFGTSHSPGESVNKRHHAGLLATFTADTFDSSNHNLGFPRRKPFGLCANRSTHTGEQTRGKVAVVLISI